MQILTTKADEGWDLGLKSGVPLRLWASRLLLLAGLALSIFVGSSYYRMRAAQSLLADQWARQNTPQAPSLPVNAEAITRLTIPRIDLDALVVEGTSHRALLLGPGHLTGTPSPGESGNAVLAAHRDTFFRNLNELNAGDDIFVLRDNRRYHYRVTRKAVVQPTDTSVLAATSQARITLITCYPPRYVGPAPKRLAIQADLAAGQ